MNKYIAIIKRVIKLRISRKTFHYEKDVKHFSLDATEITPTLYSYLRGNAFEVSVRCLVTIFVCLWLGRNVCGLPLVVDLNNVLVFGWAQ